MRPPAGCACTNRRTPAACARRIRELKSTQRRKEEAVEAKRYDDALDLRHHELDLEKELEQLRRGWEELAPQPIVSEEDIAEVVGMWTGIPLQRLMGEETARLLEMEGYLHKRVVGQDEPVKAISRAVRRARTGLKDPKRPIGTFMFLGPTGVGKTLLAKSLAEFLFGSEEALIKIDMSEFMERHNVSRLVGAPPGYVGYEEGGQLTEAVRRRPYCVILLDEIEKAHPEVFNMLLQIMEDGNLADAKGRRVDFRNAILVMTSNVGANIIKHGGALGFATSREEARLQEEEYQAMQRAGHGGPQAHLPARIPQSARRRHGLPQPEQGTDHRYRGSGVEPGARPVDRARYTARGER